MTTGRKRKRYPHPGWVSAAAKRARVTTNQKERIRSAYRPVLARIDDGNATDRSSITPRRRRTWPFSQLRARRRQPGEAPVSGRVEWIRRRAVVSAHVRPAPCRVLRAATGPRRGGRDLPCEPVATRSHAPRSRRESSALLH